jgi:hypothetical protein
VRIGETVRRPTGRWASAVHSLLRHFEAVGFEGAPHALGFDGDGREMLAFVPGEAGRPPYPATDEALVAMALLLHRMHEAQAGFDPRGRAWQRMPGMPTRGEVVCHHDLGHYNVIFRASLPVAFIDWDLACPAPRLYDVARVAAAWTPLRPDAVAAARGLPTTRRGQRLRLLCEAYNLEPGERLRLLDTVVRLNRILVRTYRVWGGELGLEPWVEGWRAGNANQALASTAWLAEHRAELEAFLR